MAKARKDAENDAVAAFIARWKGSGASERANFQPFLTELCGVLGLEPPHASTNDPTRDEYVFERSVTFHHPDGSTSTGRIDLYKRNAFVLEAKQGMAADEPARFDLTPPGGSGGKRKSAAVRGTARWSDVMLRARGQAEAYAKALPTEEGWPPFLIVCDVGHCFELFADFSGTGKHYTQFPDANGFRIPIESLGDAAIRDRLQSVWTDPHALDPAHEKAQVTREVAAYLAELAKSLEATGHAPSSVARFLTRCLFTMFAQSVGLLPGEAAFTDLLEDMRGTPERFKPMAEDLWRAMDKGTFSPALRSDLRRFNGGLFATGVDGGIEALPVDGLQLGLLIDAAARDWSQVEPAIFGTLLERALDPDERGRLGAHFTPRAYVERLILPTVMEPIREQWEAAKGAAVQLATGGDLEEARRAIRAFHNRLCELRILDPACGSGNFLYVTLEHMKRLEGEVIDLLRDLGETQETLGGAGFSVDPHQFLGIELNPRAQSVAEMVLWIGYLQWHYRTHGKTAPAEPILRNFRNIECRDALLDHGGVEHVREADGRARSVWDGKSFKTHPVTGEKIPDETARIEVIRYKNPKPAAWPEADFIVGNPPFVAGKDFRAEFGSGKAEAIWGAYPDLPQSADIVMYWWHKAADLVARGKARRFGFITTNSMHQVFARRVVQAALAARRPVSIVFAIPDHPWVDGAGNAAVRIAMTVADAGKHDGRLLTVIEERPGRDGESEVTLREQRGPVLADLRIGADVGSATPLLSNEALCSPGVKLHGAGFIVTASQAEALGRGRMPELEKIIRPYRNGRDLTARPRDVMVIDLFGYDELELRNQYPVLWQHLRDAVYASRSARADSGPDAAQYARLWWLFGKPRPELRKALAGLPRYIATVETAKHRIFQFLDAKTLPDNMLVCIALDDAYFLGILSSRIHVRWALKAGGRLGVGNDPRYNKTVCFDPFPFPVTTPTQQARIRQLAEEIDQHRKARLATSPELTLTGLYNVLEIERAGLPMSAKDRTIHEQGQVALLRALHDDLDAAVSEAYGWPVDLSEEETLTRLAALNRARSEAEMRGEVLWLRPEFQASVVRKAKAAQLDLAAPEAKRQRTTWPVELADQVLSIRRVLAAEGRPLDVTDVSKRYQRAPKARIEATLAALAALGHVRVLDDGRFAALR
jgi:hypothetical protein